MFINISDYIQKITAVKIILAAVPVLKQVYLLINFQELNYYYLNEQGELRIKKKRI
jgi:hypothetical protein